MRFSRPTNAQIFFFLLSMPFIDLAMNSILYHGRLYEDWRIWAFSFPLFFFLGAISWFLHCQYDHFIRKKYPALSETRKRNFYKIFTNFLVMTPSVLIIFYIYAHFHILGYNWSWADFKWGYLVGLSVNLVFDTLWEVLYLLKKYRESVEEKDLIEKMSNEHAFENLKNQVNPHFLFNCFNTLSSLIPEDRVEAERFLDELSKVYRYLLRNNEKGTSTVETEIKFIQSYFELLKTRYGEGLRLSIDIDKRYNPYLLPSLSLQLLVENAVKHNIVSKQQPLVMEIFTAAGNKLVVNNNLQRKPAPKISTRIGLKNIEAKYKLMRQDGFRVVEGENNFMVVLPLVWNESGN